MAKEGLASCSVISTVKRRPPERAAGSAVNAARIGAPLHAVHPPRLSTRLFSCGSCPRTLVRVRVSTGATASTRARAGRLSYVAEPTEHLCPPPLRTRRTGERPAQLPWRMLVVALSSSSSPSSTTSRWTRSTPSMSCCDPTDDACAVARHAKHVEGRGGSVCVCSRGVKRRRIPLIN